MFRGTYVVSFTAASAISPCLEKKKIRFVAQQVKMSARS